MRRGLSDLAAEGVIRLFKPATGEPGSWAYRRIATRRTHRADEQEYGAAGSSRPRRSKWHAGFAGNAVFLKRLMDAHQSQSATDQDGDLVLLMRSPWEFDRLVKEWPEVEFAAVRERTSASS